MGIYYARVITTELQLLQDIVDSKHLVDFFFCRVSTECL